MWNIRILTCLFGTLLYQSQVCGQTDVCIDRCLQGTMALCEGFLVLQGFSYCAPSYLEELTALANKKVVVIE